MKKQNKTNINTDQNVIEDVKTIDDNNKINNQEIESLKTLVEEYKNKYLRALADYQNLENRARIERGSLIKNANFSLILKLLPFLDNLEKAEAFVKDPGLKIAKDHLFQTLSEFGVEEIQVINKPFDPLVSEAIDIVVGDKDNMVVEVLRKGYKLGDKILRVAQVKVSKVIKS